MFWDDRAIDQMVHDHYPQYYPMFRDLPLQIMRVDFSRLCMLHLHGGIYADLDMFCYRNFFDELDACAVHVVEDPTGLYILENSLMIAPPGHDFIQDCMDLCLERYRYLCTNHPWWQSTVKASLRYDDLEVRPRHHFVFWLTGSDVLALMYRRNPGRIKTLTGRLFNNVASIYDPELRTRHLHTGLWSPNQRPGPIRGVGTDFESWDPFVDYSLGDRPADTGLHWDKNNADPLCVIGRESRYE